jgi:hypothetical protein
MNYGNIPISWVRLDPKHRLSAEFWLRAKPLIEHYLAQGVSEEEAVSRAITEVESEDSHGEP